MGTTDLDSFSGNHKMSEYGNNSLNNAITGSMTKISVPITVDNQQNLLSGLFSQ